MTLNAKPIAVLALLACAFSACTSDKDTPSGLGDDFSYDVSKYRKVDPSLLLFDEVDPISTGLAEPRGLAIDAADKLYIAGDEAIRILPLAGGEASEVALGAKPLCVAAAADGTLYVGLRNHVEVYDPKGTRKASWEPLGDKAVLTAIAVAPKDVFVADAGNAVVVRYDTAGKIVHRIGRPDKEKSIPGLRVPSPYLDLAVGPEGLLWVANPGRHRVEGYTFDGDLEVSWGKPSFAIDGFSGCCNPTNLALLPGNRFVTSEKGLPRVKILSIEGKLESVVAGPDQFPKLDAGFDLAVDSKGRVLVLDPAAKSVRVFVRKAEK